MIILDRSLFIGISKTFLPRAVLRAKAANCLAKRLKEKHGEVREFKTYVDPNKNCLNEYDILSLTDCKVDVIYATHHRRKEVVDKLLIVDALWYAQEQRRLHPSSPLPAICIVSGDSDFSPLISRLNMAGFHTICGDTGAKLRSIHHHAKAAYTWAQLGLHATSTTVGPQSAAPTPPVSGGPASVEPLIEAASVASDSQLGGAGEGALEGEGDVSPVDDATVEEEQRYDPVDTLREAILLCQPDANGRVRRSQAAVHFQRNSVSGLRFADVVKTAVEQNVVEIGGTLGSLWVKLTSQQQLFLMVITSGPFPENVPGCIASISNRKGTAHRHVYGFTDTTSMANFAIEHFRDTKIAQHKFLQINSLEQYSVCTVDDEEVQLSELAKNRGFDVLLKNPNCGRRWCTARNCNDNCDFIHTADGSSMAKSPTAYSAECVDECLRHLVNSIRLTTETAGPGGRVLRGAVGKKYSKFNCSIPFKDISKKAEEKGLVEMGGTLGDAWIALR